MMTFSTPIFSFPLAVYHIALDEIIDDIRTII